jgi:molybdate transport system substrate-binding protein
MPRLLALVVLALAACKPPAERELVVFAASSLKDAFGTLGADFKATHPDITLTFNFAGSQELRTQLEHGAPADVFASADLRHMDELVQAKRVGAPSLFARNELVVIVSREAASRVHRLEEFSTLERVVMGGPEVPVGRYTRQLLEKARAGAPGPEFVDALELHVVSKELSVRQVLARVSLGEAQAGFVYRSDALTVADAGVSEVPIPPALQVTAEYPIAVVSTAPHPGLARAWVDTVLSPAGQRRLVEAGFSAAAKP